MSGISSWPRILAVCLGLMVASATLPTGAAAANDNPVGHAMAPAVGASAEFRSLGNFDDASSPLFLCQRTVPPRCFGPAQLRAAYGIQPLLDAGITGAGRTIVLVDAYQSPTIQKDLAAFDAIWGLPAPPSFNIVHPFGLTRFDVHDGTQVGWSLEISIDVEWAHAIAPGAGIVVVLARSGSDVDLLRATAYAVQHRLSGSAGSLGDVIAQSFGEAEQCAPERVIDQLHSVFETAADKGITVLAASGDQGAAQRSCDGSTLLRSRAVATPASDPGVTAVGGTSLQANGITGAYGFEAAWNGSGGGFSTLFERPAYQASLHIEREGRGLPDVAYDADGLTGAIIAWSVLAPPNRVGLGVVGGTSIGTPQWAAIAALADQKAGRRLGALNQALYRIGRGPSRSTAFHDVTTGNNTFGGIAGFAAKPGWDAVTGLGTPNADILVPLLSRMGEDG